MKEFSTTKSQILISHSAAVTIANPNYELQKSQNLFMTSFKEPLINKTYLSNTSEFHEKQVYARPHDARNALRTNTIKEKSVSGRSNVDRHLNSNSWRKIKARCDFCFCIRHVSLLPASEVTKFR